MKFLFTVIFSALAAVYLNGKLHQLQSASYAEAFETCVDANKTKDITDIYDCAHKDTTVKVLTWLLTEEVQDGH